MKEESTPKASTAENVFSPELLLPAAIAGDPWLKRKLSSRVIPPKGSLHLELGKEKSVMKILGLFMCFHSIGIVRLGICVCGS